MFFGRQLDGSIDAQLLCFLDDSWLALHMLAEEYMMNDHNSSDI